MEDNSGPSELYVSGRYEDLNPGYHVQDSAWKMANVVSILSDHMIKPRSVCEVGCGAGEVLKQLERHVSEECLLTGYDINPAAQTHWEDRKSDRLKFRLGNILEGSETFDVCLCLDVIEHIPDVHHFLRGLKAFGKHHVLHIPLEMNAQMVMRGSPIRARKAAGHLHYFDKDTALATLSECGYCVVEARYTHSSIRLGRITYRVGKGWRTAILSLPRKLTALVSTDLAARTLGGFSLLVLAE